jgi:hypothetical protein
MSKKPATKGGVESMRRRRKKVLGEVENAGEGGF